MKELNALERLSTAVIAVATDRKDGGSGDPSWHAINLPLIMLFVFSARNHIHP